MAITTNKIIPYGKQQISKEDIAEVVNALKSDFLTTGPRVEEFEKRFAEYVGARYAVAVSSGTAALHLSCIAAGLGNGDELITSPITFAASSNCAFYCNAKPVFIDVNEQGLIDEERIEENITEKTKIIIPVHYSGLPCNMKRIKEIADKHSLTIIEDACHALGAGYSSCGYEGKKEERHKVGGCRHSDMACFSFHPVKHITTGEGGMITTNSEELCQKLKSLRSHGIVKEKRKFAGNDFSPWYYEMQELGYNYRLTDIQSALGISQLKKADWLIKKRRAIAGRYENALRGNEHLELIKENEWQFNSCHLFVIKAGDEQERAALFAHLHKEGILCQVHYIPVYWSPYYQKKGYKIGLCPNAEGFYKRVISIPLYPSLREKEQEKIIECIGDFYRKNIKEVN